MTFKTYLEKTGEIGHIVGINNYLVQVSGLPTLKLGETVVIENEAKGLTYDLGRETANVLMLDAKRFRIGQGVAKTNESFKIPLSEEILGRIINPLGQPMDNLGPITGEKQYLPVQKDAPGITKRARVKKPMETGVQVVDLLVPMGYGQRELVIGDAKTGKTSFLLQCLSSQAKKGVVGIYVGIGKETSAVKTVEDYLKTADVFDKTVMVIATSQNPASLNYLAPFSGMAAAEYFRDKGRDVLVIFDDLTSHAKFYREISLLTKRAPERSSYPGDIFHVQAALIERAGNIKTKEGKETSITALPVAETLENDISGFIQTNLMGMTDGHIFFDINDFRKGKLPAINAFLSVSRVGNQTKAPLDRVLAGWIKKKLVEYRRVESLAQFGTELSLETQKLLELGKKLEILFSQGPKIIIQREMQLFLCGLLLWGFWEETPQNIMKMEIKTILKNSRQFLPELSLAMQKIETLDQLRAIAEKNISKVRQILYAPL